ncbi:MAG: histidine kinase dimerization/phospho-acceptor domain-containing protein, partial [Cetobacterium sp.]
MKRISFKIFLFLNCLTYGFIGLYVLINYLFLEDYQISLKKKELATLAKEYNHKNYFSLRENSQQKGIFLRELPLNVLEGENKFKKFHPLKISQEELEERLKNSQEIIETQVGRDNINRIILIKKVDSEKLLIVTASVAPITEVIASTLKFFIYIIIFSIPFNLYVAYKLSMRMGRPIESELLALNDQLKKELEKQKQSEIFRKNFISNVTHELKTPVAIIDGYSEAILDGIISPEEIPSICVNISKEAFNINALVQELLF